MAFKICPESKVFDNLHILYDAASVSNPTSELFSPSYHAAQGMICGRATGRGTTYFLTAGTGEWVLRHYRRGGLPAKIFRDLYLGTHPEHSRAWKEWRLLTNLYQRNFPVPRPVAAGTDISGFFYRCDLITERISDVASLAELFNRGRMSEPLWHKVGACIRMFHDAGVYHADLNAQNILLDENQAVFLIDFDRCEIRDSDWWKNSNLKRLHRSLSKLAARSVDGSVAERDWGQLMAGYGR